MIDQARIAADQATGSGIPADSPDSTFANDRIDQLTLVCAAMWELMKEKLAIQDEELVNKVAALDASDGVADGKMTSASTKCAACGRTIFPKHRRCLYCGAPVVIDNIFKTI